MSFATKAMRGVRTTSEGTVYPSTSNFSNAGVIDYRPGVQFASIMEHPTPVSDSQYCVNLDKSGHTVRMNIAQVGVSNGPPLAAPHPQSVFSRPVQSLESIHDVAARVACDLCKDPSDRRTASQACMPLDQDTVAQLSSLKQQLSSLQEVYAEQHAAQQPVSALRSSESRELDIDNGLRHHAQAIRATKEQLGTLQQQLASLHADTQSHSEQLSLMDAGLMNHKTELQRLHDDTKQIGSTYSKSAASLESVQNALDHHTEAIRTLKSQPASLASELSLVQSQIDLMHEGLLNHKTMLMETMAQSPLQTQARTATSLQVSDLGGFKRLRQKC